MAARESRNDGEVTVADLDIRPEKLSIAVLAFANTGGDPDQQYFSTASPRKSSSVCQKVDGLHVIAPNSSFSCRGHAAAAISQAGRTLGVRYFASMACARPACYPDPMLVRVLIGVLCAVLLSAGIASAQTFLGPDPARAPEVVVRIQLEALQQTSDPDTAIEQVWRLAHPNNQAITGPLARFALMIKSGFAPMIGHRTHTVEAIGPSPTGELAYKVTIVADDGAVLDYLWTVGQVIDGPNAGAWLTTGVSPGRPGGRAT